MVRLIGLFDRGMTRNSSECLVKEHLAVGGERVAALCGPGSEEGDEVGDGAGVLGGAGAAADLADDDERAQAARGTIVIGGDRRVGGFGHVFAASFGLSAILATSATAFSVVTYAGAASLRSLGVRTLVAGKAVAEATPSASGAARAAFRQGIATERFNPKTALFFLSFLPQFIDRDAPAIPQPLLLGALAACPNTSADGGVSPLAGPIGARLRGCVARARGSRRRLGRAAVRAIFAGKGLYVSIVRAD